MKPACVFDSINGELRTVPAYFKGAKVYSGFARAQNVAEGTFIRPGQVLGMLRWDDGSVTPLIAPANCRGRIERFGQIREALVHRRPSQVLLIVKEQEEDNSGVWRVTDIAS